VTYQEMSRILGIEFGDRFCGKVSIGPLGPGCLIKRFIGFVPSPRGPWVLN